MKQAASLLLAILLVGCTSIASRAGAGPLLTSTGNTLPLTKEAMLTGEAETETAVSPKNGATVTAIIGTKFALGTAAAGTMTAMPSLTPTPTIPPDASWCAPGDLKTTLGLNGGMQSIFLIVGFTDIGPSPCYLQTWPQVTLLDGGGDPLDIEYGYFESGAYASTAATEQARDSAVAKIGLWPGWTAGLTLMWQNWCEGPVSGEVLIRLTLMDQPGEIRVPTGISAGGTCNAPGSPSYVGVSKLTAVPPPAGP